MLRGLVQAPVIAATLKTIVFGFLIAVAGCWHGLNAPAGAEGVGIAATRGVVGATLLVLLSNVRAGEGDSACDVTVHRFAASP